MIHKILIIGGGPAGYTAGIYAARANLKPTLILGLQPGGQLMTTTDVENYPGFRNPVQGPWLMEEIRTQAENVGTHLVSDVIERVDFSKRPFSCWGQSGSLYESECVIIATGAVARWLNVKGEDEFRGFGVSACATCDGFFFKDKTVAVVGGGNTAVEESLFLTNFAKKVILIHRRDSLRAEHIAQKRLLGNAKISPLWDSVVEEVLGDSNPKRLTSLRIKNVKTQASSLLPVDGLFVAIGHTPMSEPFKEQIALDPEGYIICPPGHTTTSIPGIFAAGDVQDRTFRQAVTAAGQGCMAALEAEHYLRNSF